MRAVSGAAVAIAVWLGWLQLSPMLGFPKTATAGMFDRFLYPMGSTGWLGWVVLLVGEGALAALYIFGVKSGRLPSGIRSGLLYGGAVWLIAGAIVMPLMALGASAAMADDPMRTSFMMLHLGPLAPVNALIGRLIYGALLGGTSRIR